MMKMAQGHKYVEDVERKDQKIRHIKKAEEKIRKLIELKGK